MTTEPSPSQNVPPAQDPDPNPPRSGRESIVLGIVIACMVLFCVLVSVIYLKWQPEPTAELVVNPGNSWLDGATIVISGGGEKDLQLTLSAENNYGGRIMLVPGQYVVIVKLNNMPVLSEPLTIKESITQRLTLNLLDAQHKSAFEQLRELSIQNKHK